MFIHIRPKTIRATATVYKVCVLVRHCVHVIKKKESLKAAMKVLAKITTKEAQSRVYIIFYLTLGMLLIICMVELYLTIEMRNKIKHKKIHPELEMRPIINATSKDVLIWYNENDVATVDKYIKLTDDFIEAHRLYPEPQNVAVACDFEHPPQRGQICPIDFDNFGPCAAPFYGYYSFSPCIFLKLNKIYGWAPSYYRSSDKLPPSMPPALVKAIHNTRKERKVWVSCEGEHDVDKENVQAINLYPSRGFPFYYFPIRHTNEEYLNPLIAVELVNPTPGFIIRIKCQAWTKDLEYRSVNSDEQQVVLRFGIMREELLYQDEMYT